VAWVLERQADAQHAIQRSSRCAQQYLAAHTEVDNQCPPTVEGKPQKLAATHSSENSAPPQLISEQPGRRHVPAQGALVEDFDAADPGIGDSRLQTGAHDLDFG